MSLFNQYTKLSKNYVTKVNGVNIVDIDKYIDTTVSLFPNSNKDELFNNILKTLSPEDIIIGDKELICSNSEKCNCIMILEHLYDNVHVVKKICYCEHYKSNVNLFSMN